MEIEILAFECMQQLFAVRANHVREVLRAVAVSPLPQTPNSVLGMMNMRGEMVSVLNTRHLLGLPDSRLKQSDHFVVMEFEGMPFALHVDHATDLLHVRRDDEKLEPATSSTPCLEFVAKTHLGIVKVVNPETLLDSQTVQHLRTFAASMSADELAPRRT